MHGLLALLSRRRTATTNTPQKNSDELAKTATTSFMSQTFVESASSWSGIAVMVFGTLAAIAGVFAWYFSEKSGEFKDAALDKFQTDSRIAIASAEARGSEANEKAAHANERAANLEKDAAQARLELELIKEKQRPRGLLAANKDRMVALLATAPKTTVDIWVTPTDPEAHGLAEQIAVLLHSASFEFKALTMIRTPLQTGVCVTYPATPDGITLGARVGEALILGGITPIMEKGVGEKFIIYVGPKP